MLKLSLLMNTARNAVIELSDGGIYQTTKEYDIWINDIFYKKTDKIVTSLYDLKPETEYVVTIKSENQVEDTIIFKTDYEFVTLNVKDFGAKGDGVHDDTHFIQAAIMACPKDSRVLIPAGVYKITNLFLKSDLKLEIQKGALLKASTERSEFAILPGFIESYDEKDEYNLGSWEGNPLDTFASIITGINVDNVVIYGEGTVDGSASDYNWWHNIRQKVGAWRPRMFFINHCNNVILQGITIQNSPCWTIHPYFSNNLGFYGLTVKNPKISPNTDGLDPESCKNVDIIGVHFSLGDDCIAIKSGKVYMGRKHKTPCENITIRQCYMQDGHGAVTVGSEIGGGVNNIFVKDCCFKDTDRGLRVKTRRGRGEDSVLDNITFDNIRMEGVLTPLVVNSFYFCDPDGKISYVQTRDPLPIDERTPYVKNLTFKNIHCTDAHVAAAYFLGLPERKIESITMENVYISYTDNPTPEYPAMTCGIDPCTKKGFYALNVDKISMKNVVIEGCDGEAFEFSGVDVIEEV